MWAILSGLGIILALLVGSIAAFVFPHWPGVPSVAVSSLTRADQYELYSLYPASLQDPDVTSPRLYRFRILGHTLISDSATRKKLNQALRTAASESDGKMGACFNPRHAIRVTHSGVTTDFLICFECKQVEVLRDGKLIADFPISRGPQQVFDEVLTKAGLPLAPKGPQ